MPLHPNTPNHFPPQTLVVADSYSESNASNYAAVYYQSSNLLNIMLAQSFKPSTTGPLSTITVYIKRDGSPTGMMHLRVHTHSGIYGTSSVPIASSVLATSDAVDMATLSASPTLVDFTFSGAEAITLTSGTPYALATYLPVPGTISSICPNLGYDLTSSSHLGNLSQINSLGNWGPFPTLDLTFYVYIAVAPPTRVGPPPHAGSPTRFP